MEKDQLKKTLSYDAIVRIFLLLGDAQGSLSPYVGETQLETLVANIARMERARIKVETILKILEE